ncbi:MAG: thermonuclease family protein [Coriobacteriia bacterium]|nr:thermonuclease family protein [Coriobacteriia bacterium]
MAPSAPMVGELTAAEVVRVVDGDTAIVVLGDGTEERVRFIGIDTPEDTSEVEEGGPEATAYTTAAVEGVTVFLELDVEERDKYGRLLAYVWLEEPADASEAEARAKMLNARILLDGYAHLMTIPPNVAYVDYLRTYEREAREASAGLWARNGDDAS